MNLQQQIDEFFSPPQGWHIMRSPKPIADRSHDWEFWHDDHDGADSGNGLAGTGSSYKDCLIQIQDIEAER